MRRDIPPYSQYLDVKNALWRSRSCGIMALKMVLEYWYRKGELKRTPLSIPALNRAARKSGAYIPNIGWSHRGLALYARRLGADGKNFDWFSLTPNAALKKLLPLLRRGPVIASVYRNPKRREGGHLVVVTDITNDRVHFLDPGAKTRARIPRFLSTRVFCIAWKRRGIVIGPRLRNRGKSVH
jgi:hypothetical protein